VFIDTSAIIAMLAGEAEQRAMARAVEAAAKRFSSGLVRLESVMALSRFDLGGPLVCGDVVDRLLIRFDIEILSIDDQISRIAVTAFSRYGKGQGHAAQLNLSDCMSYAVAKHYQLPILCKGNDFALTDIDVVKLASF